jgi:hypothetical protein
MSRQHVETSWPFPEPRASYGHHRCTHCTGIKWTSRHLWPSFSPQATYPFSTSFIMLDTAEAILAPIASGYTSNFCLQRQLTKLFPLIFKSLSHSANLKYLRPNFHLGTLRANQLTSSVPARRTPPTPIPPHATNSCTTSPSSDLIVTAEQTTVRISSKTKNSHIGILTKNRIADS